LRSALERSSLIRENRENRARLEHLNHELSQALHALQTDQEAGRGIQFQLLPADRLCIGDYRLTRRLFPSQYLSGDFIDYFPVGNKHLAFYIADVSGHGAASAFVTAMLATLVARHLEAFARGEGDVVLSPSRLLRSLNQELGLQRFRKHVTMFYAVIDLVTQRLTCASAGQYPFPLLDGEDGVSLIQTSGRPLGLFADAQFTELEISLGSSRRLLLASDGVLELLTPEPAGARIDRLVALFRQAADLDTLARALGVNPVDRRLDDVALLLLERNTQHA
jgi:serine phosphatase RsbU (regulator of sigma subunit)